MSGAWSAGRREPAGVWLAMLVFLIAAIPFWEYRTDDTFIFLRYAANLAAGAGPSFNPDQPVFGFSSPTWMLLLALCFRLGIGTLAMAKALALIAGIASILGFWRLSRGFASPAVASAATVAWSGNAWLVRWSASAMETALVVALVVWSLALWESERRRHESGFPWSAVPLAILAWTRPEGGILVALACLLAWFAGGADGRRRAAWTAALAACLLLPWFAYAHATMGHILPVTGAAKGTVGLAPGFDPLRDVARIIATTSGAEVLLWVTGGGLTWWATRRLRLTQPLAVAWLVALPVFYALTNFDVLSRYALPVVPVCVAFGFAALERLDQTSDWRLAAAVVGAGAAAFCLRVAGFDAPLVLMAGAFLGAALLGLTAPQTRRWRHWLVCAVVLVWNATVLTFVVFPHTHAFSRGVVTCFQGMGEWFRVHTNVDATVAIADIGAFGYYAERDVLDMAALVSPELIDLVDRYPIQRIAAQLEFADIARPDYLIDRWHEPARLDGALNGTFEMLPIEPCPIEGLGVRSPETIYYTAYRIHWQHFEDWRAAHDDTR